MSEPEGMTFYRPMGRKELDLVAASWWRLFPPRLPEQPIFNPVLNLEYASEIARWNMEEAGAGYVVRFRVEEAWASRYPVRTVGSRRHQELWVPAEELEEFNRNIMGQIELVAEFRQDSP